MSKYINSDELIKFRVSNDPVVIAVNAAPAADVQEVRHGKWKECFEDWRHQIQGNKCSACGFEIYGDISNFNYCPNCGAKMDEDGD